MIVRIDPFAALTEMSRRGFLIRTGATLSAGAVALLAGRPALAAVHHRRMNAKTESDIRILNTALAAEYEAIAAYGVGIDSGLLKAALTTAREFQSQHKEHADVLSKTVAKLGGKAVEARPKYDFPVSALKTEKDVLSFAANLERGAVSAYLGAVPLFHEADLAKAAASILGDEAMHWAVLRQAVGENPVPVAFVS